MNYLSVPELSLAIPAQTLIWLSNDAPSATEIDDEVVTEAIRQAEEVIDAYLRPRYTLPLEPTPTLLKGVATTIARHWLYSRRPEGADFPDAVRITYRDAIDFLRGVRDGKISIGIQATQAAQSSTDGPLVSAPERRFSDELLDQF